jgi:hypothetical protein
MMLLSLIHNLKLIQIPVNYLPRVGESSVTGDLRKAILLGLWMIGLVWRYRFVSLKAPNRRERRTNIRPTT